MAMLVYRSVRTTYDHHSPPRNPPMLLPEIFAKFFLALGLLTSGIAASVGRKKKHNKKQQQTNFG